MGVPLGLLFMALIAAVDWALLQRLVQYDIPAQQISVLSVVICLVALASVPATQPATPSSAASVTTPRNRSLQNRAAAGVSPFPDRAPRIMISGCPAVLGNWKVHHLIEEAGAAIVVER